MTEKIWRSMDYLVDIGFKKAGRGRPPKGTQERLAQAVSEGVKFSDWPKENVVVKVPARNVSVPAVKPNSVSYDTPEKLWRENETKFVDPKGKEIDPSEVCANCRPHKSLLWCYCSFPVAIGSTGKNEIVTRLSRSTSKEVFIPNA